MIIPYNFKNPVFFGDKPIVQLPLLLSELLVVLENIKKGVDRGFLVRFAGVGLIQGAQHYIPST